jgi:hypothetical protein
MIFVSIAAATKQFSSTSAHSAVGCRILLRHKDDPKALAGWLRAGSEDRVMPACVRVGQAHAMASHRRFGLSLMIAA